MSVSSASASIRPAAPVKKRRDIGDLKIALVFILPCLIGFGLFFLWPTIRGFYLSFTNYDGGNKPGKWVGLANYQQMLHDPVLAKSLLVTVEYVVINIVVQTILALMIALLMQRVVTSTLSRGTLLTPYFIAPVIAALVWFWMLDPNLGIVNVMLEKLGIGSIS